MKQPTYIGRPSVILQNKYKLDAAILVLLIKMSLKHHKVLSK